MQRRRTGPSTPVIQTKETKRDGAALCLSGGGFRATLFHLGSVRRLNELGILSQIKSFSSISGRLITSRYDMVFLKPNLNSLEEEQTNREFPGNKGTDKYLGDTCARIASQASHVGRGEISRQVTEDYLLYPQSGG